MGAVSAKVASKLAFFPPKPPSYKLISKERSGTLVMTGVAQPRNVEVMKILTGRGQAIVAVFVRNPAAQLTLLYSHGNATDLGYTFNFLVKLSIHLRVNVMGYDYSGYGQSTGKPSESNAYADIEAAYKILEVKYGIREEDVILFGQSIGSGPTVDLAAKLPKLRGVILQSGILSGFRVWSSVRRTYGFDIFSNVDKMEGVKSPVLVIHGTEDEVVDISHGKKLWELCMVKYEPLWVEGGGHSDLGMFSEYLSSLKKFVADVEDGRVPGVDNDSYKLSNESRARKLRRKTLIVPGDKTEDCARITV